MSYRKDFAPRKLADGSIEWDTIWAEVKDGTRFEVAWLPERNGKIAIATTVVLQQLQRPIPTFDTAVEGHAVTIDLPEVRATPVRGRGVLEPGSVLLLARKIGEEWLLVVVNWRRG